MTRALRLWALLALGASGAVVAQPAHPDEGRPFFAHRFGPHEYGGHDQNWWVTQDARGVVFVANWASLLEYDGRTWRTHRIPNQFVRSLATGPDGLVYVGGVGEVGVLRPDSTGTLAYESLLGALPPDARDFADIWTTYAAADGVYFQSFRQVFRWDGHQMRVWTAQGRFHKGFLVDGAFYARHEGVGLVRADGDDLRLVEGGGQFADERIDALLPHPGGDLLVVTRDQGMLLKRGGRYLPFTTDADAYLREQRVYQGTALSDSTYALSTTSGTVVLFDQRGRVLRVLGTDAGLSPDELVLHVFPDHQGGLWLALDRGLLRVDAPTALTAFGEASGLRGMVVDAFRYEDVLYAATSQGLFRLRPGPPDGPLLERSARFEPVGGQNQQVWAVVRAGGSLLSATNAGVAEWRRGETRLVSQERAFGFLPSERQPGLMYVGLKEGLGLMRLGDEGWASAGVVEGLLPGEVRSIVENEDGSLWLGMLAGGALRVWTADGRVRRTERYGVEHGLDGGAVVIQRIGEELAFYTSTGLYRFRGREAGFVRDEALTRLVLGEAASADYLLNAPAWGGVWVIRDGYLRVYREGEGGYADVTPPALRFKGVPERFLLIEERGEVWIAGEEGLVRFDPNVPKDYAPPFRALVRRVTTKGDRLLYGGAHLPGSVAEVPHAANNLRFEFAAPTFNLPEQTVYQYWLEGFDEGWSEWSDVAFKEYTNLPERRYRFHVRARNAQGVVSEVGTFTYRVLPPWYRTWWAYATYLGLAALVLWGYGHWRVRVHRQELERERVVRRQLEESNARLKLANERLHEADKLKDDLLANTSHELRTPLTAILGFADVLQEELGGEHRDFAAHIHRSGQRLLNTVNALLDMASLQADVLELDPREMDLAEEVRHAVRGLAPMAEAKGLYLHVMPEGMAVPSRLDRSALERILTNLVGNAIKFTDEGGVTVLVDGGEEEVTLTVRDTGIGIREEFLPHLFGAFKQASTGHGRSFEGNGLGLAITQRLVHLMGGDIAVESREGGGATFRVRLPRWLRRPQPEAAPEQQPPSPLRDRRVLLVEDPARPQRHLCALLGPLCRLDVAVGQEAAMERAAGIPYDLVLMDAHLHEGDAAEALRALRMAPGTAEAPAVAVAAFTLPSDAERFRAEGFADHITRPITRHRLTAQLGALLAPGRPVGVRSGS